MHEPHLYLCVLWHSPTFSSVFKAHMYDCVCVCFLSFGLKTPQYHSIDFSFGLKTASTTGLFSFGIKSPSTTGLFSFGLKSTSTTGLFSVLVKNHQRSPYPYMPNGVFAYVPVSWCGGDTALSEGTGVGVLKNNSTSTS